jgi:peptidoglycan/LPS O-acetylase OafA/YrhL
VDAFNLEKNMKIFEYKSHKFNVFNGIKSICMLWVVVGHLFSVRLQNIINVTTITKQIEGPNFLVLLASFYAVDVFFYIGGFLVAYSFLKNQMKSLMKYPLAIVHRVLRFWPSYIIAIIIYYSIMIHTGSGPLWYKLQTWGQF